MIFFNSKQDKKQRKMEMGIEGVKSEGNKVRNKGLKMSIPACRARIMTTKFDPNNWHELYLN